MVMVGVGSWGLVRVGVMVGVGVRVGLQVRVGVSGRVGGWDEDFCYMYFRYKP